jgi:hypothetical protein
METKLIESGQYGQHLPLCIHKHISSQSIHGALFYLTSDGVVMQLPEGPLTCCTLLGLQASGCV